MLEALRRSRAGHPDQRCQVTHVATRGRARAFRVGMASIVPPTLPVREAKRWTRFLFRVLVQGEEMKVNRSSASIILVLTKSKYWPSKPFSPK
jgi:hypothetical protein